MISTAQLVGPLSTQWAEYLKQVPHDFFHTAEYHAFSAAAVNAEAWLLDLWGSRQVCGMAVFAAAYRNCGQRWSAVPGCHLGVRLFRSARFTTAVTTRASYAQAWETFVETWRTQSVVSVFTRFHPILSNQAWLQPDWTIPGVLGRHYREGKTVVIDLSKSPEEIWAGYQRKLRQHLRRVEREQQFTTSHDLDWEQLDDFISMYYETLERNNATPFYFFSKDYFTALKQILGPHGSLFLCRYGEAPVAAFLLIEYGGIVSVHLAASHERFSALSPNKWLFHAAQILARSRGNRYLHIGGGRGSRDDDPLFRFKAQFSSTYLPFYTGRWILDQQAYELLAEQRRRASQAERQQVARSQLIFRSTARRSWMRAVLSLSPRPNSRESTKVLSLHLGLVRHPRNLPREQPD